MTIFGSGQTRQDWCVCVAMCMSVYVRYTPLSPVVFRGREDFTGSRNGVVVDIMETSGTKIMVSGPIICQLCERRQRNKEVLKEIGFSTPQYF